MYDIITTLGKSLIQHGNYNNRIYLMKLTQDDFPEIIAKLEKMAREKGYTKIFAKIPDYAQEEFINQGYRIEASIPNFYYGISKGYFLGKYFSDERKQLKDSGVINKVILTAKGKSVDNPRPNVPKEIICRQCREGDLSQMTTLYKKVFTSYPFPIHDENYIKKTMSDNVYYFGAWYKKNLLALASMETDLQASNVEMTDFATEPDFRGRNLALILLQLMEEYARKMGLKTAYTIARAYSYGMNITFAKADYTYAGTLPNNTNISGGLESMNVWYKRLC